MASRKDFNIPYSIDVAVLILRIGSSFFMIAHGFSKFIKLYYGNFDFPDPLGIGSGLSLIGAVFAEVICSLFVAAGFLTRPALLFQIFTMGVAAFVVHVADPLDVKEHSLLFLIIYLAIFITGPGRLSVDKRLFG